MKKTLLTIMVGAAMMSVASCNFLGGEKADSSKKANNDTETTAVEPEVVEPLSLTAREWVSDPIKSYMTEDSRSNPMIGYTLILNDDGTGKIEGYLVVDGVRVEEEGGYVDNVPVNYVYDATTMKGTIVLVEELDYHPGNQMKYDFVCDAQDKTLKLDVGNYYNDKPEAPALRYITFRVNG
ncbi:MAG: hypothetical protein J6X86_01350 [Bacteroidales bacterium]|nr:hypothetical protein [Bacteroidales bacterium]